MSKNNIHFVISERKILLRILDIVFVISGLYLVGFIFEFDYFKVSSDNWIWSIVLAIYLTVFATIFELYNLKKASKLDVVVKNVLWTTSITVLFYLLTPFYTPMLPNNRLQIVYFFLAINIALLLWRYAYIALITSPRFNKNVILIAHAKDIDAIVQSLHKSDPNYRVIGYYNTDESNKINLDHLQIDAYKLEDLRPSKLNKNYSEIVVATPLSYGISVALNNQLISLLKNNVPIRHYNQVYEELTQRIPVQYVDRDFYRYFPFSRSNQNKLYLFFSRILELLFSILGLLCALVILPFILIGNLLANRGPLFYTQTRVG